VTGKVVVLCTANVCRSVYAAAMLDAVLAAQGIAVASAGLAVRSSLPPCALVLRRAEHEGLTVLQEDSRQVRTADLATADIVLVMTTAQRSAVARSQPLIRQRIFTLIEAAVVAQALAEQGVRNSTLQNHIAQMHRQRSSVDLPVVQDTRRVLGIVLRRSRHARTAISIEDGHVSTARGEHQNSLNLVQKYTGQFLAAWSAQPWFTGSPTSEQP